MCLYVYLINMNMSINWERQDLVHEKELRISPPRFKTGIFMSLLCQSVYWNFELWSKYWSNNPCCKYEFTSSPYTYLNVIIDKYNVHLYHLRRIPLMAFVVGIEMI